jgi:hypothetical protein
VINLNEICGAVGVLWETFGGTLTEKGFKVLDEHIGMIYGDSITLDRANETPYSSGRRDFASNNSCLWYWFLHLSVPELVILLALL